MDIHSEAYKEEAQELLSDLESCLLELETRPEDGELIDRAFRALHTIKGSGAMFGFDDIAHFTHEVETVFDLVRDGKINVTKNLINLTLESCDFIKLLLNTSYENTKEDELKAVRIVNALRELIPQVSEKEPESETDTVSVEPEIEKNCLFRIKFIPFENIFLTGTNPLSLLDEIRTLGNTRVFGQIRNDIDPELFDPEKCYTSWDIFLCTHYGENAIKDVFIFVEDEAEINIEMVAEENDSEEDRQFDKMCDKVFDPGMNSPQEIETGLQNKVEADEKPRAEKPEPETEKKEEVKSNQENEKKQKQQKTAVSNIRVSSDKLDRLVDLVGELVTVQSRLSQTAVKYSIPDLTLISEEVERLTADLRDNAMSIRMMPIGSTFGNFTRLVRDLSNELGKIVELKTEGEDTELDKTVIERLNDPLVHLIRNSVDHGIELPDIRKSAGKPAKGTIKLTAMHAGADVLIKVIDDGIGLDADKIRAKAVEKGMLAKDAEISDEEIYSYILKPGFSTAANVTNISGRGVGTDVVLKAIESLRGSLDIKSEKGKGTTITLRIPLTLAIIEGLLVRISEWFYIIPLSSVNECIELTKEDIKKAHGRKTADVRGKLVPYVNIREIFGINGTIPEIQQVVVAEVDDQRMGFVVDEVVGEHQTVIKSLGKVYNNVKEVSGATILGDGTLALILDPVKLIETAEIENSK